MLRGLFARSSGRPDPAPDRDATERVKTLARALADLPAGTELTASEIVCLDPACPGTETVLLVMRPTQRTRAVKLAGPASAITEQQLRSALVEAGFGVHG